MRTKSHLFLDHLFVFNRAAEIFYTCWWKDQDGIYNMNIIYIIATQTEETMHYHLHIKTEKSIDSRTRQTDTP